MPVPDPLPLTELLASARAGRREALGEAFAVVAAELRHVAAALLARESPGHTLQPTALVNEAFLKLCSQRSTAIADRHQFLLVAAQAMRRILVDHARARLRQKRGAGCEPEPLDDVATHIDLPAVDMVALGEALDRLGERDERLARTVELRFFAGLQADEAARVLGVSLRTCERDWMLARAFLRRQLAS